jgi:diguanylate cyclase (GGDEF)-like protein/PAS domain S-box-containing protein
MGRRASDHELLEVMPDAVVITNANGAMVFANRKAEALTGYTAAELLGAKVELLVAPGLRASHARARKSFYEVGAARMMGSPDLDLALRRKDGSLLPVEIALGPAANETVAVIRDITERRRMELALEHQALHDPLTDVANRTLFFDRLRQALYAARRERGLVAVVMLDLDGFKRINDDHGHATGDHVLKKLADRLSAGLRATDTAARIGGDEFALILPHVSNVAAVERMVRRRLATVQKQVMMRRRRIDLRVSAGIAIYPADGRDADSLLRRADAAMYSAKHKGQLIGLAGRPSSSGARPSAG